MRRLASLPSLEISLALIQKSKSLPLFLVTHLGFEEEISNLLRTSLASLCPSAQGSPSQGCKTQCSLTELCFFSHRSNPDCFISGITQGEQMQKGIIYRPIHTCLPVYKNQYDYQYTTLRSEQVIMCI